MFSVVKVIVYVFGVDTLLAAGADRAAGWLVWAAGFTIVAASVVALGADNLKRRLAYSTVSQLSYVVMSAAILAPLSLVGAIVHIAAHAVEDHAFFAVVRHLHRRAQDRRPASSTASAGACRGPWSVSPSPRCR